jgi:thioredoxin reductase (NADPH)
METIGFDLRQMSRTPLAPAHVEAMRAAGRERQYPAGTMIARPGTPMDSFVYVEAGEIEVVDAYTGERSLPSGLGPGNIWAKSAF